MNKKNDLTYESALSELESIVGTIEKGSLEIRQLSPMLRRAQELLKFCKLQLLQVEDDVNSILNAEEEQ